MRRERNAVVERRSGLCHFSGTVIWFSNHSTIFIAGKIMNISMTTEKTRVMIKSIMFYNP